MTRNSAGLTLPPRPGSLFDENAGSTLSANQQALLCAHEASRQPRRLVSFDPVGGRIRPIFDPNPEFGRLRLGEVRRLQWTNAVGLKAFGDLVLPPDRQVGEKLPLIIVQYTSKGFLRGGTGDEYPIQAFASQGFAVLSVNRPEPFYGTGVVADSLDRTARWKAEQTDWNDRRSVLSSLEAAIALLDRMGVIDPRRIGITGLSEGQTSTQYALIHSNLFAAAAMSGCCEDEFNNMVLGGPKSAQEDLAQGRPFGGTDAQKFWAHLSLAENASHLNIPILVQASDDEYLGSLHTYAAMHKAERPFELYVFPNEHHIKWQPAHRASIYQRNIDWFRFWFMGQEDASHSKIEQYARWQSVRQRTTDVRTLQHR